MEWPKATAVPITKQHQDNGQEAKETHIMAKMPKGKGGDKPPVSKTKDKGGKCPHCGGKLDAKGKCAKCSGKRY